MHGSSGDREAREVPKKNEEEYPKVLLAVILKGVKGKEDGKGKIKVIGDG